MKLHEPKTKEVITYVNTPLTPQQMLENMVTYYIIDGNPPAYEREGDRCFYFKDYGDHSKKCGIGCQLPDELARKIETATPGGCSVSSLLGTSEEYGISGMQSEVKREVKNFISPADAELAQALQGAHDEAARQGGTDMPKFRNHLWKMLAIVAAKYKLVVQPVQES